MTITFVRVRLTVREPRMREHSTRSIERNAVAVRTAREEDDEVGFRVILHLDKPEVCVLLPDVERLTKCRVDVVTRQVRCVLRDGVGQNILRPGYP